MLEALEFTIGVALVIYMLNDVFQSVVVPRSTPGRYRLSRLVIRNGWQLCRGLGLRSGSSGARERLFGTFAPMAVVVLLVLWVTGIILGFAFIFFALRHQLNPVVSDFPTAFYFAGTSVLTRLRWWSLSFIEYGLSFPLMPAKAGIQFLTLGPRFRGDERG